MNTEDQGIHLPIRDAVTGGSGPANGGRGDFFNGEDDMSHTPFSRWSSPVFVHGW